MVAFKGAVVPAAAVGVGLVAALGWYWFGQPGASAQPEVVASAATTVAPNLPQAGLAQSAATGAISGQALEVVDVESYTYLRIGQPGQAGVWAAVPKAEVRQGQQVSVVGGEEMRDFTSSTLKRTFPSIWFGNLASAQAANAGPAASPVSPHGVGGPMMGGEGALPAGHGAPQAAGDDVAVTKVARAEGPTGHVVAELFEQRDSLAGKKVRVRGTVVKSMPAIMGRTFVHVRDGSGDPAQGTHDLTVTTQATPEVGKVVLAEGVVAKDRDFGAGYTYPVLIEQAELVEE